MPGKSSVVNPTDFENQLAYSMLNEAISNKKIKSVLQLASSKLFIHVVKPIKDTLGETKSLSNLSAPLLNSVKMLALQNTSSEKQFGAILNGYDKAEDITKSIDNIYILIAAIEQTLKNVDSIVTIQDMLKLLKSIADLSFCYFEYFKDKQTKAFSNIKDMVWLTPEELDGRILRSELGQEPVCAITQGISETPADFKPASSGVGMNSGKALFAGVSMKLRLQIIIENYDKIRTLCSELKNQISKTRDLTKKASLENQLRELEDKQLKIATMKMQQYNISLLKDNRQSIDDLAKRYETTFEKLTKLADSERKSQAPLVANISRSTARTLITMLDLDAFLNDQKKFDFDTAQILSNCLMSFYIWGGHHSYTEVTEVYNRMLDYIALMHPEQLDKVSIPDKPSDARYMVAPDKVENRLPYVAFGNYETFFYKDYRKNIVEHESDYKIDTGITLK